jgi:hypothetical protein
VSRLRVRGRAGLLWALRITVAAVASYVAALWMLPAELPLLAPLTAMLVVQVTPLSLLEVGFDRVISVVLGVSLAVGLSAVLPLTWWSLGLLILTSLLLGQALRLRANLIEVPISAMLVFGVGALATDAAASDRIVETLVGAVVGVLANLVWPPRVASADAGQAIDEVADGLSELLRAAADALEGAESDAELVEVTETFLERARQVNHRMPDVGAAVILAERSRRFNVRAVGSPDLNPGLRQGLEAMEHSVVAVRVMFRSFRDAAVAADRAESERLDPVLLLLGARLCRTSARAIDAFGQMVRDDALGSPEAAARSIAALQDRLTELHHLLRDLQRFQDTAGPGRLELVVSTVSTVRRLIDELDPGERVRRQIRITRAGRHQRSGRAPHEPQEITPDEPTEILRRPIRPRRDQS